MPPSADYQQNFIPPSDDDLPIEAAQVLHGVQETREMPKSQTFPSGLSEEQTLSESAGFGQPQDAPTVPLPVADAQPAWAAGHLAMVPKRMRQPDCMLPARTDSSLWGMVNRRRSRRPRGRFLRATAVCSRRICPIALWPAATGASRIRSGVCGACTGSISVCAAESAVECAHDYRLRLCVHQSVGWLDFLDYRFGHGAQVGREEPGIGDCRYHHRHD